VGGSSKPARRLLCRHQRFHQVAQGCDRNAVLQFKNYSSFTATSRRLGVRQKIITTKKAPTAAALFHLQAHGLSHRMCLPGRGIKFRLMLKRGALSAICGMQWRKKQRVEQNFRRSETTKGHIAPAFAALTPHSTCRAVGRGM
jgi:hypothetical protein